MNEDERLCVKYAGYLSAFIKRNRSLENLVGCMGDDFSSACALFGPHCNIVIALDPKLEISISMSHLFISLLILRNMFDVVDIILYFRTATGNQKVDEISSNNKPDETSLLLRYQQYHSRYNCTKHDHS